MKVRKGDLVLIKTGKDAGRTGIVQKVIAKKNKVVVEGLNMYKKHQKADAYGRKSEILDIIKPIDISNIMLVCPSCKKTVRVKFKVVNGKKSRICSKCGAEIDINKSNIVKGESKQKTGKSESNVKTKLKDGVDKND